MNYYGSLDAKKIDDYYLFEGTTKHLYIFAFVGRAAGRSKLHAII
jgi:hypothetical protein